jgi:hypothetical protein
METNAQIVYYVRLLREENDFCLFKCAVFGSVICDIAILKVLNRNFFSVIRIRIVFNADPDPGFAFLLSHFAEAYVCMFQSFKQICLK